jgi:hypothetical protein
MPGFLNITYRFFGHQGVKNEDAWFFCSISGESTRVHYKLHRIEGDFKTRI